MAVLNIAPTRSNLIRVKKDLQFAREGYEILDRKREVLTSELVRVAHAADVLQKEVWKILEGAYRALEKAELTLGSDHVEWPALAANKTVDVHLKVVLKETGLAADTLRAWERRYGLPLPQRTPGGHRLYSQHDIETIKWLMARHAEGLSISRAVDLWNEQIASGQDPLAGTVSTTFTSHQAVPPVAPDTTFNTLRAEWIEACTDFDEVTAEQIINHAFSVFPIESVCTEVIQKGISDIGNLWYENKLSVQQEHFASGLALRRIVPAGSQHDE